MFVMSNQLSNQYGIRRFIQKVEIKQKGYC